jgi:hypothetical protein
MEGKVSIFKLYCVIKRYVQIILSDYMPHLSSVNATLELAMT